MKPDERNIAELTARFGGRIEKLHVNFTGQTVKIGEKLATIYSPAMMTAQKELLEAISYKDSNPEFYKATRNKLKLWDLTEAQIDAIEKEGKTSSYFDVLSPISGTVTRRDVAVGDYIKEGISLFQVIDLSKVWVMFDAYESDLPWIKQSDKVTFTTKSVPGKTFTGKISFIDPVLDAKTRTASIRVEAANGGDLLKPEMFVNGVVTSSIAGNKKDLTIPKTAVLWTGKRAVVYVKVPNREQPTFEYREIELGPVAGDFYVVAGGLNAGEEIAVNGVFKIDAAAQLAGKPSMMNPEAGIESGRNEQVMAAAQLQQDVSEVEGDVKTHEHAASPAEKPQVPEKFKEQLTKFYESYLPMKDAFVATDPTAVKEKAENMKSRLQKVDMELLSGATHMEWMEYLDPMKKALEKIIVSNDIELQRQGFSDLNLVMYKVIKRFGLENETVYYQYCPMAFDNKGAYWFSEQKEIRNPYFGDKMLKCGETREEFDFKK